MLSFPNAKINLGLNITEKRPDGYHNLETIFYPVPIEDALEINILNEGNGKFRLHQAGLEIEGEAESNLVVKAYKLLDDRFNLPPVDIHLFLDFSNSRELGEYAFFKVIDHSFVPFFYGKLGNFFQGHFRMMRFYFCKGIPCRDENVRLHQPYPYRADVERVRRNRHRSHG